MYSNYYLNIYLPIIIINSVFIELLSIHILIVKVLFKYLPHFHVNEDSPVNEQILYFAKSFFFI